MTTNLSTTNTFRNILCPVDFSVQSRHALQYAALLARRTDARLTALFVEDPLLASAARNLSVSPTTLRELQRFVERIAARYGINHTSMACETAEGVPGKEITRAARRLRSDLVVMGAHGLTGAAKMMLGSTTQRVLRTAPVPVLAIPPVAPKGSTVISRNWPEKGAVVPVDLGRHLRPDAIAATKVAARLGTVATLLHVVPARDRSRLLKAHARLETLIRTAKLTPIPHFRVLAGRPGEQIAAMAADGEADLVILTRRRAAGLFGARLGSISYQVLCEARTPVLALPPRARRLRS